jgi:tetratricopeptide (TPR) repeat protein
MSRLFAKEKIMQKSPLPSTTAPWPGRTGKVKTMITLVFCTLALCFAGSSMADESTLHRDASKTGAYQGHRSSRWADYRGDNFSIHMNKGFEAFMNNDLDQAIEMYSVAAKIKRRNTYLAFANRGQVYLARGEYALAIDDFTRVLELKPNELSAYLARGNIHLAMGNPDEAISDFTKALDAKPDYAPALIDRGRLWCAKGDPDKAFADFSKALEIDDKAPRVLIAMARFLSTTPEDRYRNGARAIGLTQKAIQITHKWEGMIKKQTSSEVMTFERLGLAPQYDTLAAAYAETGNFEEAVATQQKAISLLANENSGQHLPAFYAHLKAYEEKTPWRESPR